MVWSPEGVLRAMSFRFKNIALAALCCVLTTGLSAWADTVKTNPVTGESET